MKNGQKLPVVLLEGTGILFLLACSACGTAENGTVGNKTVDDRTVGNGIFDEMRHVDAVASVERYLTEMRVVGPWRGDEAYERELLRTIKRNETNVDPETGFLWNTHEQPKGYHSQFEYGTKVRPTRETMYHAAMLIAGPSQEHQKQGRRLLEKVIDLQDQDPESPTFGIWPWYYEESLPEMASPDYNWADFLGAILATILHDYPDRLSPELSEKVRKSLEYCALAIIDRDVKPSYTNIAMMGATVTAAAGELLDRKDFLDYGRMRIRRNLEHYRETGNFNEYNSPNYTPVVIQELERMLYLVDDETCRRATAELLVGAWQTVAEHYHVPTRQWTGPFSRTYADMISPRVRSVILAQALVKSADEAMIFSPFVPRLTCPEPFRHYFTEIPQGEIERRHVFNKTRRDRLEIGTTWLTPTATLGSASFHTFWEQARGLIGYWVVPDSDEPAVLKLAFLHDGRDFASGCARNRQSGGKTLSAIGVLRNQGSMHPTFDRPKDGVFHAESFEIVYQLKAKGAQGRELSPGVFELSAGAMRAVLHVADNCIFDGQPVEWHLEQLEESNEIRTIKLVGVCYRGKSKAFSLDLLGETRIGVGLELLQREQLPSLNKVIIFDAETPDGQNGIWYAIGWEPMFENNSRESMFIAPAQPINR